MLFRLKADAPRSPLIGMALASCVRCQGTGLVLTTTKLCACVDRAVFRVCLDKYRYCAVAADRINAVSLEGASSRPLTYGRRNEEFAADFYLTAKRALADGPVDFGVFRLHYLEGHDWKVCASRYRLSRGNVFHAFYRIEERVGRLLHTLEPYPLFPIDGYFQTAQRGTRAVAMPARPEPLRVQPLRPPLAA